MKLILRHMCVFVSREEVTSIHGLLVLYSKVFTE